jgi:hypothetical protein
LSDDRERLREAWAANTVGSTVDHVSVVLPSFSLGETVVAHYATRLPALEHRFLLAGLMLHRIDTCTIVFLACQAPDDTVLDYVAGLGPPEGRESFRRRFRVVVVDDPGGRAVAAKLLDQPQLLEELRDELKGRVAFLEPWNVTADEVALATLLDIPVNGTAPDLWPLGFKSAGRRTFRAADVPVPLGVEDVHDLDGVAEAAAAIRRQHPAAAGVVVKHDNSGAGDGNHVIRFDTELGSQLEAIPEWYVHDLELGAVVEELVEGEDFSSPSVQVDITPYGEVRVLSTHEQILGGESGQVYTGCRFPARSAYAADLARYGEAIGRVLVKEGALGRFGVDFVAVRRGKGWDLRALEVNLRRGGTTHPFCVLRHLVPGRYDGPTGLWVADDGSTRAYRSTDNLVSPRWLGLPPQRVIEAVRAAGGDWDRGTGTGVVLHMLSGLAIDGRCGLTAVGRDDDEAGRLYALARAAITASAATS